MYNIYSWKSYEWLCWKYLWKWCFIFNKLFTLSSSFFCKSPCCNKVPCSRAEPARLSFSLYYIFGIMRKIVCQSRNNGKTRMDGPFWLRISSKSPIFFDQKTTIHTAYHHLMHNIIVTISYLIGNRYDLTITDSFSFQHSFVCFLHHFLLSSRIATFHAIYR